MSAYVALCKPIVVCGKSKHTAVRLHELNGSAVGHISVAPGFTPLSSSVGRLFHLSIIFGGGAGQLFSLLYAQRCTKWLEYICDDAFI